MGLAPIMFAILWPQRWRQRLAKQVWWRSFVTTRGDYKSSFYEFGSTILIIQEQVKHRTKKRKRSRFELRQSQGGVLYVWLSGEYSQRVTAMRNGGYLELLSNISISLVAIVNTPLSSRECRKQLLPWIRCAVRQTMTQRGFLTLPPLKSAARVAYWKTSLTPSPVRAEHSR